MYTATSTISQDPGSEPVHELRSPCTPVVGEPETGAAELHGIAREAAARLREACFQGPWAEAVGRYRDVLAQLDDTGPARAVLLHDLAGLACARGQYLAAGIWARQALACHTDLKSRRYAIDLAGLADALAGQGNAAAAADHYERAIALLVAHDPDDPEIAYARHSLGEARAALGQRDAAAVAYVDSLARQAAIFGESHPKIAGTLSDLAALHADHGEVAEARRLSACAVEMVADLAVMHPIRAGVEALARALAPMASI